MLYTFAFIAATIFLTGWFYFQEDNRKSYWSQTFLLIAIMLWAGSVLSADVSLSQKLAVLFRDLLVLGSTGFLVMLLKHRHALKLVPAFLLLFGINSCYSPYLLVNLEKPRPIEETITAPINDNISSEELAKNGELLIELKEGHTITDLSALLTKYNLDYQLAFAPDDKSATTLDNYYTIDIPDNQLVNTPNIRLKTIKEELAKNPAIHYIENNEVIRLSPLEELTAAVNKSDYLVNDPGLEFSWGFTPMKVNELYSFFQKNKIRPFRKATIAILDTGVDANHEDIKANYRSTQQKYDNDPRGHGTHCAGIAAAVSNNGVGIASFSPSTDFVELTSIKVLGASGMGTQRGIIQGIIEAADLEVDVISMSLGGPSSDSRQKAYEKAVQYANEKGAIVVVAAGNSNRSAKKFSPANAPGVITVSAIDRELQRAVFSNYISEVSMGIAAPGVNIYSTIPNNKYASYNGTSMATPYVAGLVGMMRSINPKLTTKEVHQILTATGIDTRNTVETGKLIQPFKAVRAIMD